MRLITKPRRKQRWTRPKQMLLQVSYARDDGRLSFIWRWTAVVWTVTLACAGKTGSGLFGKKPVPIEELEASYVAAASAVRDKSDLYVDICKAVASQQFMWHCCHNFC
jgi:hypothetical protein